MPIEAEEAATKAITAIDAAFQMRLETSRVHVRQNEFSFAARKGGARGFIARVRYNKARMESKERQPVNVPAIIFANVAALRSLRLTFAEPQHLVLEIQSASGSWEKRYEYPVQALAMHGVRSIAANLAFVIGDARLAPLKAEIGFVEGAEESFKPRNAEEAAAFVHEGVSHYAPLHREAAERGIERPNPYGFQTTVELKAPSGQMCRIFFDTNNTNDKHKPYFVFVENRGPVV